jgi:hypothetical protein
VIDAASTQRDLGRYANDCRAADERAGHCKGSNARYSVSNRNNATRIHLKATKNIPPGSEIFVSYGASYWKLFVAMVSGQSNSINSSALHSVALGKNNFINGFSSFCLGENNVAQGNNKPLYLSWCGL